MQTGTGEIGIYPSEFSLNTTSSSSLLKRAMDRIFKQTFAWKKYRQPLQPPLKMLVIDVKSDSEELILGSFSEYKSLV
jgi:hypothetical protein